MKKKILAVVMGVLFVADVVMTLFNIDIFTRFLKEKRKKNDERIERKRYSYRAPYSSYAARRYSGRYPWGKEEK